MPQVLVVGGMLKCTHGGMLRMLTGDSRLTVDGNNAVLHTQEVGLTFAPGSPGVISPCTFNVSGSNVPCTIPAPATAGFSTLLVVGTQGVLLDTATGTTSNGTPWSVQNAGQTKLESSA